MLAYLGDVANKFICNQWKKKEMLTDLHFSG